MVDVLDIWDGSILNAGQEYLPVLLYTMYNIHENGYEHDTNLFDVWLRKGEKRMDQQERLTM